MNIKRITVFAGHYGSGKTNIAVNYALYLKGLGYDTVISDLDIVNPYFRTKDSMAELYKAGIRLISSAYANTNVDVPAMPEALYSVTDDRTKYNVLDVGGDDRGALALGRFVGAIKEENNYEMLSVINMYRPLTRTPEDALAVIREIEAACRLPFTGIVNNSNIGELTREEDILASLLYAQKVSSLAGIPVFMTTVREDLAKSLTDKIPDVFPLRLQSKRIWN